jgi:mono/diheme cytochrome c family protein
MKRVHLIRLSIAVLALGAASVTAASDDQPAFSAGGRRFEQRSGEAIYRSICQGCHMPDGKGATGAGTYPALANNARLSGAPYPVITVLTGRKDMPAFGRVLDNDQIAAVVGYVRTHFGNAYADPVQPQLVDSLRIK